MHRGEILTALTTLIALIALIALATLIALIALIALATLIALIALATLIALIRVKGSRGEVRSGYYTGSTGGRAIEERSKQEKARRVF